MTDIATVTHPPAVMRKDPTQRPSPAAALGEAQTGTIGPGAGLCAHNASTEALRKSFR
jgi:hypothetical protein